MAPSRRILEQALTRLGFSPHAYDQILKVARTMADGWWENRDTFSSNTVELGFDATVQPDDTAHGETRTADKSDVCSTTLQLAGRPKVTLVIHR